MVMLSKLHWVLPKSSVVHDRFYVAGLGRYIKMQVYSNRPIAFDNKPVKQNYCLMNLHIAGA